MSNPISPCRPVNVCAPADGYLTNLNLRPGSLLQLGSGSVYALLMLPAVRTILCGQRTQSLTVSLRMRPVWRAWIDGVILSMIRAKLVNPVGGT